MKAGAETGPILVTVDDAQWMDSASADIGQFVANRLAGTRVAFLVASHPQPQGADPWEGECFGRIDLGGLDLSSARRLLGAGSPAVAPEVAANLHAATAGNPLGLHELRRSLSEDQLAGREEIEDPAPVGRAVRRSFHGQVEGLPPDTQRALLIAAAEGMGEVGPILIAVRQSGLGDAALEPAEAAGVITVRDGELSFRHPLLRSTIYHQAPPLDRRTAHRALAHALGESAPGIRRARHLAAAAVGPDESAAKALGEAAGEGRSRGGDAAAGRAMALAARLTPQADKRADRLLEAATDYALAGQPTRAEQLLDEALAAAFDPPRRTVAQRVRGGLEMRAGDPATACATLAAEADRIESLDPARAAPLLLDAALAQMISGDVAPVGAIARRIVLLDGHVEPSVAVLAKAVAATAAIAEGQAQETGAILALEGRPIESAGLGATFHAAGMAGLGLVWSGELETARRILTQLIAAARQDGPVGALVLPLAAMSDLEFRAGRWTAAHTHAREAVKSAELSGQLTLEPFGLAAMARVEAVRGDERSCRANARRALDRAESSGADGASLAAVAALASLEISYRRYELASAHLERAEDTARRLHVAEPAVALWEPDLIEALVETGRLEEAGRAFSRLKRRAERSNNEWTAAATTRCELLLAGRRGDDAHYAVATSQHAALGMPFDRARMDLDAGRRLRRLGRCADAQLHLRRGLECFEQLRAGPWADQARVALNDARYGPAEDDACAIAALTGQEQRVALIVAEGASNREAAAVLFLSEKTIEYHLGHTYRKLGVRSRTQLARRLAGAERRTSPAGP